jgi:hypothetical protein
MSTTNNAVLQAFNVANVEVVAGPAAAPGTAVRLTNTLSRCTKAASTGSFILPSIGTGEANEPMILVNDSAVTVNIYPAANEKTNGNAQATAFQVTTGLTGICIPVVNSVGNYPTTLDWRCALIP